MSYDIAGHVVNIPHVHSNGIYCFHSYQFLFHSHSISKIVNLSLYSLPHPMNNFPFLPIPIQRIPFS